VVKAPLLLLPSFATIIDDAAIGAVGSIPLLPLSTTTAIAAIEDCHHRCHTVSNDDRQKPAPAVVVCCQRPVWRSLITEAAVNGSRSDGGLC
jgi:hypothetical protein